MFDYFQEAVQTNIENIVDPNKLIVPKDSLEIRKAGSWLYSLGDCLRMKITFFKEQNKRIDTVSIFDSFGHEVQRDRYDVRGFLSLRETLDFDGNVANETMFTPTGKIVYQSYYRRTPEGNVINSLLRLVNYRGNDYYFDNLDELLRFFFDEINANADGNNVFISDRSYIVEAGLVNMVTPRKMLCYAHNVMTTIPDKPLTSPLFDQVKFELASPKVDGLILQTKAQLDDLRKASKSKKLMMVIPSAVLDERELKVTNVPMKKRPKHQLITVARIHEQKHLEHTILAFALIKAKLTDATLSIYGFVNDEKLHEKLKKLVADKGLTDSVFFHNYIVDLRTAYENASLFLSTSRYEGYGMAMVEALSYGVPIISYNIKYGPADIILDGNNGFLVKSGDYRKLALKALSLLQNPQKLQTFSNKAKQSSQRYNFRNSWKAWQQVLTTIERGTSHD
ncbi:glycosyltransferase [Lactiplantibacillus plantarum]|uniref:glycosyltransferase n=1 Tax=Lactiplantibacillus plantarum TaxID=1590 RepID=UPI001BA7BC77|nr:glycosyltransferase [Lactiplantibacillus plantarum]MBS0953012.1 glycosyltransferase [Lactiplantibacillus plantarum]